MRPGKKSQAREAQTNACPTQPTGRGKRKLSDETAALKADRQNQRREQKLEQTFDGTRPKALALTSSAIRQNSLAGSGYVKRKPGPHRRPQNQQRPENRIADFFGVHTKCSPAG